jgi:hypothetical protein
VDNKTQLEILLDILKQMAVMNASIARIEVDVANHIKRTNIIETEVKYLHRQINIAQGAIALISLIAIIVSILKAVGALS